MLTKKPLGVLCLGALALLPAGTLRADVAPSMLVMAGAGRPGFADGIGAAAAFNKPIRLAPFGNAAILVADIFNHAIRIVTKDGHVRTLVGAPDRQGHRDGPSAVASLSSPHGVGFGADGRIAVAEAGSHTIRVLTPDPAVDGGFTVSTAAGVAGEKGNRDGPAGQALFNSPHAAIWGRDGALYTPDIGNATVRRIAGGSVETIAGQQAGSFRYPMDIAWTPDGRLVVADAGTNQLQVVGDVGRLVAVDVRGALSTPHGVAVGPDGTYYVADMGSHRVLAIGPGGTLRTMAGVEGQAGSDATHLNKPAAVLVHAGWLWIADLDNHRICAVALP